MRIIFVAFIFFTFWACHGDDSNDNNQNNNSGDSNPANSQVAGKWKGPLETKAVGGRLDEEEVSVVLDADKNFALTVVGQPNASAKGQWDQGTDSLIISVTASSIQPPFFPGRSTTLHYALLGDTMKLSTLNEDYVFRLRRDSPPPTPTGPTGPTTDNPALGKWTCQSSQGLNWTLKVKSPSEGFWASYSSSGSAQVSMTGSYTNQTRDYILKIDTCLDKDDLIGNRIRLTTSDKSATMELQQPAKTGNTFQTVDSANCTRVE